MGQASITCHVEEPSPLVIREASRSNKLLKHRGAIIVDGTQQE